MTDEGRILAVDPGEKRIGIALSDPGRWLAKPLTVIRHVSIVEDCRKLAALAAENAANLILIGQALGGDGEETPQSRHARNIVETLHVLTDVPIVLWDESGTTIDARQNSVQQGLRQKQRRGHLDDRAAAVLLRSYLDRIDSAGD